MPCWTQFVRRCLLLMAFSLPAGSASWAVAQSSNAGFAATGDVTAAVDNGISMERSRQWLQAIDHYEASLKLFPENQQLQYGLRRSKIHFSVERRYSDHSFEHDLLPRSRQDALRLFDEVLLQVRSGYVDPISSTSFVAHGTESLYLALANDRFVALHLSRATPDRIAEMRRVLRERYWNKPVASHDEARQTVTEVCDLAASYLQLPPTAVVMEYIFGGCNALDDYSTFMTPDKLKDLYGNIEGEFVGLGIEMKGELGKGMLLMNVLADSPASEGGMREGDYIVSIEGTDCRNMTTDEAARRLKGPSGSRVRLQIQSGDGGPVREGIFARRAVVVKSIPVATIVDEVNGVGYIQMTGFQKGSAAELDAALSNLNRRGMKSLIWDLRGNPGGLLTAAVEVMDRFLEDGVIVSTRGRTTDQNWSYSAHRPGTWRIPLVLLVDGESASASEIVAGAVGDHQRGTIIGRQTYGKWSVQSIYPISHGTGLRLTTAKFYSPKGRTLGKIGVTPDVLVDKPKSVAAAYRGNVEEQLSLDPDVQKGIESLRRQYSQR